MKNLITIFSCLIFITVLLITGCSQSNYLVKLEEQNMATVRMVHNELIKNGNINIDIFDEVLTDNYVRHCQAMPPDLQEIHGSEQLKIFVKDFLIAVPDITETIDLMFADSDKVAYITTMKGTQTGTMDGLPPSGKEFTCVNIIIQRLEDGKIAETWISWDNVAILTQLGFFPPDQQSKP